MVLCTFAQGMQAQTVGDSLSLITDSLSLQNSVSTKPSLKTRIKQKGNIFVRFLKSFNDYDSTYISPNYYNYTAMVQNTNHFQVYKLSGTDSEGNTQKIIAQPDSKIKLGPYFGWRWIFLGYTFDLKHPSVLGKSSSFNLSLYSSMLGCDFVYIKNSGNFKLRKAVGFDNVTPKSVRDIPFSGLSTRTISFNLYYVFNHRRFSYPAAYNQSTVQRKSCGSGLLGLGYSRQNTDYDYTQLPDELTATLIDELKFSNISYKYYYLSGGYAYNWVFARNWLLGGSFMPSIGLRKAKGEKINGREVLLDLKNLSFDCTSRVGLVWNNTHWFAGASFISHLYLYRKSNLSLTNSVNYANIYVGFFFNRKKEFRK